MHKDAQRHLISDATAEAVETIDLAVRASTRVHGDAITV